MGQKGGQCRKRQEGGGNGCYRKHLEKPSIAGRSVVGSCQSAGRRRSVRGGRRRSVRGGRRRSVRGGRGRGRRRSVRGGNYGCKQPKWGPECL